MNNVCYAVVAAAIGVTATFSSASAQYFGPRPYPAPMARPMMGPVGGYMSPRPMYVPPRLPPPVVVRTPYYPQQIYPQAAYPQQPYPQPAYPQQPYPQQVDPGYGSAPSSGNDGMGVDLSGMGPYAGAAAGRALMSNPYTAPFAPWAAGRVNANAQSAGREYTPGTAAVKTFTGVSARDIQTYGIAGGPNSEVNKVKRFFGL